MAMLMPRTVVVRNKSLSCFRPQQLRNSAVASGGTKDRFDIRNVRLEIQRSPNGNAKGLIHSPLEFLPRRVYAQPATAHKRT